MQEVSKRKLNKPRMWDVSHAFPPAVLTASGLKGIISAEWHPQAKLILSNEFCKLASNKVPKGHVCKSKSDNWLNLVFSSLSVF